MDPATLAHFQANAAGGYPPPPAPPQPQQAPQWTPEQLAAWQAQQAPKQPSPAPEQQAQPQPVALPAMASPPPDVERAFAATEPEPEPEPEPAKPKRGRPKGSGTAAERAALYAARAQVIAVSVEAQLPDTRLVDLLAMIEGGAA